MNATTLENIVDTSHFVEDKTIVGSEKAKRILSICLPFEKTQLADIAKDVKTDFIKGYDDRFPRIDMEIVRNSVKKIDDVAVPAFATYDVFSENNTCKRTFGINSSEYRNSSKLALQLVPHSPTMMKFYSHLWNNWDSSDGGVFITCGIGFCFGFLSLLSNLIVLKSIMIPVGVIGVLMLIYGIFMTTRASNSLNLSRSFTHTFSGLVPDNVRELIKNEKCNFDSIILVEESYNWKIDDSIEIHKKPNPDPLIVGMKGNIYFLLTKFDVTPLENLIATEFSA
jgi:hypothetical protein